MAAKLNDYISRLEELNIPVAYDHFVETAEPPYICWINAQSRTTGADLYHIIKRSTVSIVLYAIERDFDLENRILKIYSDFEISIESVYDDSHQVYATVFEFEIIEKL